MAHTLILGITGTGKTTLAFSIAQAYKAQGVPVYVLDPFKRAEWNADFITDDPDGFLDFVFTHKSAAVFVDESGDVIGRWSGDLQKLATQSRQFGHRVHFITQRAKQFDVNMRTQCENIFLFKQSPDDAKELARDFVAPSLIDAGSLRKGEFLSKIGVDGPVRRAKIF